MKKIRLSILLTAALSMGMLSACNTQGDQNATDMNDVSYNRIANNGSDARTLYPDQYRNGYYGQYGRQYSMNDPFFQYQNGDRLSRPYFRGDQQFRENQQAPAQQQPQPQPDGTAVLSNIEKQVIQLTNQERQKRGLPALKADTKLAKVAQEKSNDMLENGYFSHTSPNYGSPFQMMQEFGVTYQSAAENIAAGQDSAQQVVRAWMNSPGHRRNILNRELTHIGVGCAKGGRQGIYWTQMFVEK